MGGQGCGALTPVHHSWHWSEAVVQSRSCTPILIWLLAALMSVLRRVSALFVVKWSPNIWTTMSTIWRPESNTWTLRWKGALPGASGSSRGGTEWSYPRYVQLNRYYIAMHCYALAFTLLPITSHYFTTHSDDFFPIIWSLNSISRRKLISNLSFLVLSDNCWQLVLLFIRGAVFCHLLFKRLSHILNHYCDNRLSVPMPALDYRCNYVLSLALS